MDNESAVEVTGSARPSFLLSCERSGSTLLRWLVDAHPEAVSPGELRLGTLAFDLYMAISRTLTADCAEAERVQSTLREVRRTIDGLMSKFAIERGVQVWCEKSPGNLRYLDYLANAYPDALYICLYRSCHDVVRSCLSLSREGFMSDLIPYVREQPGNLVAAMTLNWVEQNERLIRFELRNPWISVRVRYEDLVARPTSEVARLLDFLGLPPDSGIVNRAFSVPHGSGGGDSKIVTRDGITKASVSAVDELSWDGISPSLRHRVNELSRILGYRGIP